MTLRPAELYEQDFYAWTRHQAEALRRLKELRLNAKLDLAHLAEEIRDLGQERRDALRSWTTRVVERLLLLEHSAAWEPRHGWVGEIVDFRRDIEERLTNPAPRPRLPAAAALRTGAARSRPQARGLRIAFDQMK
jgi:hypothetical protein